LHGLQLFSDYLAAVGRFPSGSAWIEVVMSYHVAGFVHEQRVGFGVSGIEDKF